MQRTDVLTEIIFFLRQSAIPQGGPTDRKADIDPIMLDVNTRFSDVGGLESHIHCLKEMVVFPIMYPHVFDRFHITPPKGVLFHGPPGESQISQRFFSCKFSDQTIIILRLNICKHSKFKKKIRIS